MKLRIFFSSVALGVLAAAPTAFAFLPNSPMMSPRNPGDIRPLPQFDHRFMDRGAQWNMSGIALNLMAREKSQRPEVDAFADRMVADHTRALAHQTRLAQRLGIRLPFLPSEDQLAIAERLAALEGEAFNQAFARVMVDSHAVTLQLFRDEAAYGFDPDARHYAAGLLTMLQQHYEHAQALEREVHGGQATRMPGGHTPHR